MVQRTLVAAKAMEDQHGVSVEVIDLRSLSPVDWETIYASVRKTNRVIVAYEDSLSWGYGAEIAARIADETFAYLDAPVKRVAATDTFVAYAPELEDVILPQVESLRRAMEEILAFSGIHPEQMKGPKLYWSSGPFAALRVQFEPISSPRGSLLPPQSHCPRRVRAPWPAESPG